MINCLIWKLTFKLKYTDTIFIKAICENLTPPFKMESRLAYTEGNMCLNIQKIKSWKTKL